MSTGGLERVLLPMSSLLGWGLVTVGALMVLHVFGLNIQPLLTIGGVGGVAIGFGAQSVTSNAISGINLVSGQLSQHSLQNPSRRLSLPMQYLASIW